MCKERFRGSGVVGADQDVGAAPVGVGDLCECPVAYRDVIGGGQDHETLTSRFHEVVVQQVIRTAESASDQRE
ncbi:hypothetical protein [Streptomyces formicae]|uniref:Uncharacterized protein n=1 Tax=Streptomyces formicae TaxID=1616117 RepID=A0ABY3WMC9_9ACTN|nr:hypothetical protein [Streptomyces formicae]UNM13300.1 hypothetical protein J4032_18985 [Streptomyces formicae]